jgi:hypothetical protein
MSNLGIFFALSALELAALNQRVALGEQRAWADATHAERRAEAPSRLLDVDVAWDAMHRCLGDGTLDEDAGRHPLRAAVLGGQPVPGDPGLRLRLNSPGVVRDLAPRLADIDEGEFRACYFAIPAGDYLMVPNEADFRYTWDHFRQVQSFYGQAAVHGDHVLFAAYQ